jgi:G3E family GTPase
MPCAGRAAVALTVITGLDAAVKARVAQALLRRDPGDWALLDNDGGGAKAAAGELAVPAARSDGCACCTGQVMLHAALVELLRRHRPRRVLLVAAAAAEPAALRRALAQGHAMRAWAGAHVLCVFDPGKAAMLGDTARALWSAQHADADAVIRCDAATGMAAIEAQLAAAESASKASSRRIVS